MNQYSARFWRGEKPETTIAATIRVQLRTVKAGCSRSFLGATRRDSGHRSVATPLRRVDAASTSPMIPSRKKASHGTFCERGMRTSGGSRKDSRKAAPKQSAMSAFEATQIQTNCAGVLLCRGFMRGSVSRGSGDNTLLCEQNYAYADEEYGQPTAAVYVFVEEDFCRCGVADEGE